MWAGPSGGRKREFEPLSKNSENWRHDGEEKRKPTSGPPGHTTSPSAREPQYVEDVTVKPLGGRRGRPEGNRASRTESPVYYFKTDHACGEGERVGVGSTKGAVLRDEG